MRRLLIIAVPLALLPACAGQSESDQSEATRADSAPAAPEQVAVAGSCSNLTIVAQSPIAIDSPVADASLPQVTLNYAPSPAKLFNTGQTVRVNLNGRDTLRVGGVGYAAEEFHFHWPGEHEVGTDSFPAEIHIVHKRADGTAVALGTFVRQGAHNAAWNEIWTHLPRPGTDTVPLRAVALRQLFSLEPSLDGEQVYRYCGSLTTPQYEEGINWLVRAQAIEMDSVQLDKLRAVMGRYSRELQDLNGRVVRVRP